MRPFFNQYNVFGFPVQGGLPFFPPVPVRRFIVPTLDQRGIYEVCTTGLIENLEGETTADYGISRRIWNALPCQCVILWKVRHPISQNGADLPVSVVVPTNSSDSTVAGSLNGSKIPVVDNKGTQVQGRDVTVPTGSTSGGTQQQVGYTTEHWVYIDKAAGIFRLLGVTSQSSPARAAVASEGGSDTPAAASVKLK